MDRDQDGGRNTVLLVAVILLHESEPASDAEWKDLCSINERIASGTVLMSMSLLDVDPENIRDHRQRVTPQAIVIIDSLLTVNPEAPEVIADGDVSSAPEEQRDIQEDGDEEGGPHPKISAEKSVDKVMFADPAPILVDIPLEEGGIRIETNVQEKV